MTREQIERWYKGICGQFGKAANRETAEVYSEKLAKLSNHDELKSILDEFFEGDRVPTIKEVKETYWMRTRSQRREDDDKPAEWSPTKRLTWYDPGAHRWWYGPARPTTADLQDSRNWTAKMWQCAVTREEPIWPYWQVSVWTYQHQSGGFTYGFDVVEKPEPPGQRETGKTVADMDLRENDVLEGFSDDEDELPF